jgi:hypothetical protein
MLSAIIVAVFLAVPYLKKRIFHQTAKNATSNGAKTRIGGGGIMLKITNLHKTFNPGTINAKTALDGIDLHLKTAISSR